MAPAGLPKYISYVPYDLNLEFASLKTIGYSSAYMYRISYIFTQLRFIIYLNKLHLDDNQRIIVKIQREGIGYA